MQLLQQVAKIVNFSDMCKNYAKKNAIFSLDMVKSSLVATIKLRMFEIGLTQTKVAAMLFYCIGSVTPCAFREHHRTSVGHLWAFGGCGASNICASIYYICAESLAFWYFVAKVVAINSLQVRRSLLLRQKKGLATFS